MVNGLVLAFTDYRLSINLISYYINPPLANSSFPFSSSWIIVTIQLIVDHVVQIKIAISKIVMKIYMVTLNNNYYLAIFINHHYFIVTS